ncbi:flagellar basal body P-ring formation protein FlgA [Sulfurimonas lithotrophica]|uniref:Flagellar basal body P-ring formation protein FlgA n=1 Tax=Sulfurimonas lithotrophica TaxID=2590022 RepID=A0A5P8P0T6_9BACT|nr:flagellar basal body P-ring formation chaperone FlgA [Sulfurimonas lithotrophica]QFR49325.1 flagellar basal body P-ring formation protein FlgA [Sulfurimonas lithotrophica]
MLFKLFFIFLLSLNIYALEHIKQTYYIDSHNINSSLFFKDKKNILLYTIPQQNYSLKIKKSQLQKLLKENGFKDFIINSRYVYFEINSPINTSKIELFLKKHYKQKYKTINIKHITVKPRSYMQELPKNYVIDIRRRNHLSKDGVISIEDNFHKKYFFNYLIDADIDVVQAKSKINKDEELSQRNIKIKTIKLEKFRALPLQYIPTSEFQAKHHIKAYKTLTYRDIEKLSLVKKGQSVSVWLNNSGISISFVAKALQSGKLNDIITIQKSNGKRLKAKIVAKQKVELK